MGDKIFTVEQVAELTRFERLQTLAELNATPSKKRRNQVNANLTDAEYARFTSFVTALGQKHGLLARLWIVERMDAELRLAGEGIHREAGDPLPSISGLTLGQPGPTVAPSRKGREKDKNQTPVK